MKIGWLLRSRKLASLGSMLGVAACVVIGGRLYQWRQELTVPETETESVQLQTETMPVATETEPQETLPQLADSQIELLEQIENAIEHDRLDEAAKLMLDHGERLWVLYHDVLGGEPYLFSDGQLSDELEGEGLVFRKPSTVFYGEFADGRPEGQVTAMQVIRIDYPRYDYSSGIWSKGQMNGQGTVGYHYYEGVGEENRAVSRTGTFVKDKMDGEVIYSTTNAEDAVATWNMTVEKGNLVLDEQWTFDEEKKTYQLVTNEYGGHAFVTSEEAAKSMMFENMIPWE